MNKYTITRLLTNTSELRPSTYSQPFRTFIEKITPEQRPPVNNGLKGGRCVQIWLFEKKKF